MKKIIAIIIRIKLKMIMIIIYNLQRKGLEES